MKILAIPATNSIKGLNFQLLTYAAKEIDGGLIPGAEVEFIDINDYETVIFSPQREEADGIPALAQQLFDKLGAADALMFSFAEHNGSFTAGWKNLHDWMSRIEMEIYQDKPVVMFGATPGGRAAAGVLGSATTSAPFFGANLVASLGVGSFFDTFDSEAGEIKDPELKAKFLEALASLGKALS